MKALVLTVLAACSFATASAQDADKIKELEQKVQRLEERLAKVEHHVANSQSTTREAKKMMEVARRHVDVEKLNFKSADIQKAEQLYQKAAQLLSNDESKVLLDSVVSIYPQLNRAGCAQLYRAQQEAGELKERLLKDCINRFNTCYYLDGAQVGPLAIFQLAYYYQETERKRDARKLFKQLRHKHPEAVGHDGELLSSKIE